MSTSPQPENPFASPQSEDAGVAPNPTPAWRDGELVVVAPDGELPQRCARCNGEAVGDFRRLHLGKPRFVMKQPMIWAILIPVICFIPVFVYIVTGAQWKWPDWPAWLPQLPLEKEYIYQSVMWILIALMVVEKAIRNNLRAGNQCFRYWLCRKHRWYTDFAKVFDFIPILMIALISTFESGSLLLLIFLTIPASFLMYLLSRHTVQPYETKRHNGLVWLSGFGPEFCASLPPYSQESAEAELTPTRTSAP